MEENTHVTKRNVDRGKRRTIGGIYYSGTVNRCEINIVVQKRIEGDDRVRLLGNWQTGGVPEVM